MQIHIKIWMTINKTANKSYDSRHDTIEDEMDQKEFDIQGAGHYKFGEFVISNSTTPSNSSAEYIAPDFIIQQMNKKTTNPDFKPRRSFRSNKNNNDRKQFDLMSEDECEKNSNNSNDKYKDINVNFYENDTA